MRQRILLWVLGLVVSVPVVFLITVVLAILVGTWIDNTFPPPEGSLNGGLGTMVGILFWVVEIAVIGFSAYMAFEMWPMPEAEEKGELQ